MQNLRFPQTRFGFFIIVLLGLGVFFRFFNLDHKVYWHDEVYTSLRAAGFTSREISQELFQNRIVPAPELQKYQRLKQGSTPADTINSLAVEDPQHPPLYFLMARFWMQGFGSTLIASRTLPALLSLLALPLMYGLAWELFASRMVAALTTALLALSPFDVLFAQIARQYSLLTVCVIGSSFLLLRALRLQTWQHWGLYMLGAAIGLYTHLFFGLTLMGQGVYVLLHKQERAKAPIQRSPLFRYLVAITLSLLLYTPWLLVLITHSQQALKVTNWAKTRLDIIHFGKLWILSFTALFFDLDFGIDSVWTYVMRLPFLLLIAVAVYTVCRCTRWETRLFIFTLIFVPFLILVFSDLLLETRRSTVSRYLIPCFPGVQLAIGYFLATKLQIKQLWRVVLALLVTGSIVSCTVSAFSDTWWNNIPSYFNAEVARHINATPFPLLLSDQGDDGTIVGNLISLSYLLNKDIELLLLSKSPNLELLPSNRQPLLFQPSQKLRQVFEQKQGRLESVFPGGGLWRLVK